jgi:uncharacterized repeat protein (TIGR02543 family)
MQVSASQGVTLSSDATADGMEALWRWSVHSFFNCNKHTSWPITADFSTAGKPAAWGETYLSATGTSAKLPTSVSSTYTLPKPVKEGYDFVGWFNNSAGTGTALTTISAGWKGTLYAIWKVIDDVQYLIDVNKGKIEDATARKLTSNELYEYQHYLVELRRQQFALRDMVKPVLCRSKVNITPVYDVFDTSIPWDQEGSNFAIAPLGLYTYAKQRFDDPRALEEVDYEYNENAKWVLDFRNPEHIYELFELYGDLETEMDLDVESTAAALIDTLNFYRMRANLSEEHNIILDAKINQVSNNSICERLKKEFGVTHSPNYISTIYKQKICGKIAEAATLHYDYYLNREIANAWKMCTCCGKYKLRDTREYMRRARSSDGLSSICKVCDKEKRDKIKRGEK